jgi:TatD DNase family protein
MAPPADRNPHPLAIEGHDLNHPANIELAYQGLAEIRELPLSELAEAVAENFQRLFGERPTAA